MDNLFKYLAELSRCEWNADSRNGIMYNGITPDKGCKYYDALLSQMNTESQSRLVGLHQTQLIAIYSKIVEVCECQYDVITQEAVQSLKRDSNHGENTADITLGEYVVDMFGIQESYRRELRSFVEKLLGIATDDNKSQNNNSMVESETRNSKVIKGVAGLAKHLGFGITMAQAIVNSKLLMTNGSQYKAGKSWLFNPEKIDDLLKENPNLLENVHIKRRK